MNNDVLVVVLASLQATTPIMSSPEGGDFLDAALLRLCRLGGSVCVVGDDPAILALAGKYGALTLGSELDLDAPYECLPHAGKAAMNALASAGIKAGAYVIADIRNPEVASLVQSAQLLLAEHGAGLILSGHEPRDHPCQLFAAFEIVASGRVSRNGAECSLPPAGGPAAARSNSRR
jgi:hypothetical protein